MVHKLLGNKGKREKRLILVFLGWGMTSRPFEGLHRHGYDIILLWDYRELGIDWGITEGYEEICIIGWSMGVFAAAHTTQSLENRVSLRLSVNGTLQPVSNRLGIPEKIFYGTLDNLNERNLEKFYRRMFTSREKWENFKATRPEREIEELKEELHSISMAQYFSSEPVRRCDVALISEEDRIFPSANVWRFWSKEIGRQKDEQFNDGTKGKAKANCIRALEGGHFVELQKIIDRYVVDKETAGEKFAASAEDYIENAVAQQDIRKRLEEMLKGSPDGLRMLARKINILEIGGGLKSFADFFETECYPLSHKNYWDINIEDSRSENSLSKRCDAETEVWRQQPRIYDLVVSSSTVQWFNSPGKFASRLAQIVSKHAIILISTYVRNNLPEILQISGVGLHLPSFSEWCEIFGKNFDIEQAYEYKYELSFGSSREALKHLSLTGVNGLGVNLAPSKIREMLEIYPQRLDGRYYLTFKPALFCLRPKKKK